MLIALEGFGHLNLTIEQSSTSYLTIALHPDMNIQEHPALFFLLSSALSALVWIGFIPLNNIPLCLLYSLLFGFISSKAMLGWAFPISLSNDNFTHNILEFPFIYLFISKFLLTFVAIWNPTISQKSRNINTTTSGSGSSMMDILFSEAPLVFACAVPFFGLLYALSTNVYNIAHSGIVWSAIVGFSTLCLTTRARELYIESSNIIGTNRNNLNRIQAKSTRNSIGISVCIPTSILTIFWMCFAIVNTHGLDKDLLIPLSSFTLLCTKPSAILRDTSPIILVGMFCSIFWIGSTIYAVLLKGYGSDPALESFQKSDDWLGLDSDVSIWTNTAVTWPLLNLLQVLAPVPGIISGIYLSYGCTEDVLFVFAILSLVPVFAAQISSLRYLGILGMIFAAGKGYRLTDQQQRSDRLI